MQNISIVILSLIALYTLLGLFIYVFQELLLFHSKSLDPDYQFKFDFEFQERNYEMQDGALINGLFIPSNSSKGIILYFHGNSDNVTRWGKVCHFFTQYNYDVLVCDYRGYGKSNGKRTMQNLFSDAEELYSELLQDYNEADIVIYGRSIGSGIACWLASNTNSSRLILETPFHSINDINYFRFLILPAEFILNYTFPNYKNIKLVKSGISILHGTKDWIVPYSSGVKLYKSIAETHDVALTTIKGGKHNNLVEFEEFSREIESILSSR